MKYARYSSIEAFADDTLEILLENEVQNNLPISFIGNKAAYKDEWFLASIKDANGIVVLIAACTPPFNIVLYEAGNRMNYEAVNLLCDEMKNTEIAVPGVLAEKGLALRFAEAYAEGGRFQRNLSMNLMRLDKVNEIERAPGICRPMREDDMFFTPYWAKSFAEECRIEVFGIPEYVDQLKERIGKDTHYIWDDGHPVSQAIHTRNTRNGAVIAGVYTPPHYRGKGYAASVVAELSNLLLERGCKFTCLFADAENPVSCGLYKKIGYYDLCVFDEINFEISK